MTVFFKLDGQGTVESLDVAETDLLLRMRAEGLGCQQDQVAAEETASPTSACFFIGNHHGTLWLNVEVDLGDRDQRDSRSRSPVQID